MTKKTVWLFISTLLIIALLAIAIPAGIAGIAEIEKQRTAQIVAKTEQMRVEIDADNAAFIRNVAWTCLLFVLVSASLQSGAMIFLAWHGVGLGRELRKLAEKTRILMRRGNE